MNILEYENYQEKILHGDPLFPYITYLCSIPLDFGYVPMHWHDEMEIIYIKKGNGTITVDFTQHTVSAGDIALILPGQLHSIGQFESESMEYENIIFHPNMLISKKTDTCNTDYLVPLLSGNVSLPLLYTPTVHTMRRFLPASTRTMKSVKLIRPVISSLSKGSYFCCFIFCCTNAAQRNHPGKTAANP